MIRLRPYRDADEERLLSWGADEDTYYRWTAGTLGEPPITSGQFRKLTERMRFVALDGDGPVGFFTFRVPGNDADELRFGFVIVDPEKRGRGVGRTMLRLGAEYAFRIYGAKRVTLGVLEDNLPARACYAAAGFTETGVRESYRFRGADRIAIEMEARRADGKN